MMWIASIAAGQGAGLHQYPFTHRGILARPAVGLRLFPLCVVVHLSLVRAGILAWTLACAPLAEHAVDQRDDS